MYFGEHVKDLREHGIHTIWQLNGYDVEQLKELAKTTPLTESALLLAKGLIKNDRAIERLVAAQIKLSQYWNRVEDSDENATMSLKPQNQPSLSI